MQKTDTVNMIGPYMEGPYTSWHENGQMESTGSYRDDKKDGWWVTWHGNGYLKKEGQFGFGDSVGTWITWHENGQRAEEVTYRKSMKHGCYFTWHPHGGVSKALYYKHDKLHGLCRWRNSNGRLEKEQFYVEGKLLVTFYADNHRFFSHSEPGQYHNIEHDLWIEWGEGRTWFRVGKRIGGKNNGKWTVWSWDGEKLDIIEY